MEVIGGARREALLDQGESNERDIGGTRKEVVELRECKASPQHISPCFSGVAGARRDVLSRGKQEVGEFSLKKDSAE